DALRLQVREQLVPATGANGVLVIDVLIGRVHGRRSDPGNRAKRLVIPRGPGAPCLVPLLQGPELHEQYRRLQRVETAVEPDFFVIVLPRASVQAKLRQPTAKGIVL